MSNAVVVVTGAGRGIGECVARSLAKEGAKVVLSGRTVSALEGVRDAINMVDMDEADWDRIFNTNVRGLFLSSREAGRRFRDAGAGRAINIASVFGLVGRPGFSAYCASKGAVINFTRSVAAEWARFGAQMNAVAPGYIATDINAEMRADEAAYKKVLRGIPAYRMGTPEELANVVTYLALNAPDFLTGQTIAVDGGESSV